ncbi:MAG: hypothetical protein EBR79_02535 [Proteobacteria bacterium]|nr:hypothetical protein [Pseudomonadota bacterium]NBX86614.1 hypothetical protein [Pseudomonadota bacterium]
MQLLRSIPLWAWFFITLGLNYTIYNPFGGFSLFHLWTKTDRWIQWTEPMKILLTVLVLVAFALVVMATFMALRLAGLLIMGAVLGCVVWVLHVNGILNVSNPTAWKYLPQPLLAVVWTVGLQWPKIRAAITGSLTTDDIERNA